MSRILTTAKTFICAEEGATLAEYGLLLALIAVVCLGAVTILGGKISDMFTSVSGSV